MRCFVCERIGMIRRGENPYFVRELSSGYVVLGDIQRFKGYTLLLCRECKKELHELDPAFRAQFLSDMALTAEAVFRAFGPDKLHYELLGVGNGVHMHWHIFPRRAGDTPEPGPVWRLPKAEMNAEKYRPSPDEIAEMKNKLNAELDRLLLQRRG